MAIIDLTDYFSAGAHQPCPECDGAGELDFTADGEGIVVCGVCLGDQWLLDRSPRGASRFVDHTPLVHSCHRCKPDDWPKLRPLVFLDCETTGLDPTRHKVWEIGYINETGAVAVQMSWDVDLTNAEPRALQISSYFDRSGHGPWHIVLSTRRAVAFQVMRDLEGAVIGGSNPGFDLAFVGAWLTEQKQAPLWHHKPFDVTTWVAGAMGWPQGLSLQQTAERLDDLTHGAVGYDPDAHHEALYDAWLARQVYAVAALVRGVWTAADPFAYEDIELADAASPTARANA